MENIIYLLVLLVFSYVAYRHINTKKREKFIDGFNLPSKIIDNILSTYPHLKEDDAQKVAKGLKEYFFVCNMANLKMVSMPSRVVDVAWHEFILFTREYKAFCQKGFGRFLHHTPAEAMQSQTIAQDGIKRAWRLSCQREDINPQEAHKLPLLFSIDSELNIPDGFKYALNCSGSKDNYCAGHIGCGGGCSGGGCGGDSGCGGGGD